MSETYFQQLNVLPDEDYKKLMLDKDEVFFSGTGTITIKKDGSVSKKEYDRGVFESANSSRNLILNLMFDIEKFRDYYPNTFITSIYAVQNILKTKGVINPKCASSVMYRNNVITPWHMHSLFKGVTADKFWVSIFYMHPNWDTSYGGQLVVGLKKEENLATYDCLSNSVVIHNGYYGHGVEHLKKGYEGHRDILLTHWVCD